MEITKAHLDNGKKANPSVTEGSWGESGSKVGEIIEDQTDNEEH